MREEEARAGYYRGKGRKREGLRGRRAREEEVRAEDYKGLGVEGSPDAFYFGPVSSVDQQCQDIGIEKVSGLTH